MPSLRHQPGWPHLDHIRAPIDEAETLGGTDQERADLIGLLNAGFQRGAVVPRMEGKGTEMRIRNFSAYSPKALAGINKLASTLEDRASGSLWKKRQRKRGSSGLTFGK
jgi:hypothetical protein